MIYLSLNCFGFGTKAKEEARDENSKAVIQNALRKAFSPEFLNRVDDMIMFRSLERHDIHKIIDLELDKLFKRIHDLGYLLELTEKAKDFIVERGYDEKFGARPLKRVIQDKIQNQLANFILSGKVKEHSKIKAIFEPSKEQDQANFDTEEQEDTKPSTAGKVKFLVKG